jgi:hypothetical protein
MVTRIMFEEDRGTRLWKGILEALPTKIRFGHRGSQGFFSPETNPPNNSNLTPNIECVIAHWRAIFRLDRTARVAPLMVELDRDELHLHPPAWKC